MASRRISVVALRSTSFESAFERALAIGLAMEETYRNQDGLAVRRRLIEVVTLDQVDGSDLDGREVYGRTESPDLADVPFDTEFHPEQSRPSMTGI